jgi:hypothetical protein
LQATATWAKLKQDLAKELTGASADTVEVLLAFTHEAEEGAKACLERITSVTDGIKAPYLTANAQPGVVDRQQKQQPLLYHTGC